MLPSLNIVIVNWNSAHQLSDCLKSIASSDLNQFKLDRIVVVDNASTDQSLAGLEDIYLPLNIIKNSENKGFGVACNQGAAIGKSDYILFLNPDTRVFKDSLYKAVNFMEKSLSEQVGVVGIQLVDDQGIVHHSCSRFPTLITFLGSTFGIDRVIKNKLTSSFMIDWDHSSTQSVDQIMGAFYLIRSDIFNRLNGFDESFFVYYEDLDLSYRLNELGWSSYYLADAQLFHKKNGTSDAIKATRLFYFLRSRILYGYKHFSSIQATTILIVSLFVEPITRIVFSIVKLSFSQVTETLFAYVQLFSNLPAIFKLVRQQINK